MQQCNQQPVDLSDYDDDQVSLDEELIYVVRNNNLQEKEKVDKVKDLVRDGADVNFKDANNKNNTALHVAVHKHELKVIELLVKNGAKIDIKNDKNRSPLDIANHFNREDIVEILESRVKWSENRKYNRQLSNQQRRLISQQHQRRNKFLKRPGTTGGMDGHFYEIDLLILGKIRGERDTDRFYLATNVNGVGAFDDVVIRYWSSEGEKKESKIIFLQAKHVEDPKKGKITIEKFTNQKNDDGKFYLGKYFIDYLKSRENFKEKQKDPVFNGNFRQLDVRYIIYTNSILDEQFDKSRIVEAERNIFSTKSKENRGEAFKFSLDDKNDDLIKLFTSISSKQRIKSLAKALVSCICGKLNYNNMMANEILSTYHVFLSKNAIEINKEKKTNEKGNEYREGKINHNFLEMGNKDQLEKEFHEELLYEYAENVLFSEKICSELTDVVKRNDLVNKVTKSLQFSGKVDLDVIEKLGGSAFILDANSKQLKFADKNKLKNESAKKFIGDLINKLGNLTGYKFDIPYELIAKELNEQIEKEPLKLHVNFGNLSPTFKKQEHLIGQLIKLFKQYKCEKVIRIDDNTVGHEKILTDGDLKNIGKLVGNLLVFDQKGKMLRMVNEECLEGYVLDLFKKLKAAALSEGLNLDGYWFDIKVKTFPRDSLVNEGEDRVGVEEFLSKLEIFTGQAGDNELKEIIKNEIRDLHKLTTAEIEENYLKIRNKAEEFWKRDDYYLEKDDDFFTSILRFNIQFDVTRPTVLFTGRNKELEEVHRLLQDGSKLAFITGLGGIGKSELARKYISVYSGSYDGNLIWIDAKKFRSLAESFYRLAENNLEINIKDTEGNKRNTKLIVEDVYRFFARRKSLFIFDDAKGYKNIKRFLPEYPYSNNENRKILITTRIRDWKIDEEREIKEITLEELKPDEAEKFVEDFLEIENDSHKEDVKKLTKQLQYFPLALRQAVAYIQQEDKKLNRRGVGKFEIIDYLEKRQKQENKVLENEYYKKSDRYTKTVFTTWITTLEKIAEDRRYGRQAIDILNIMAYFTPHKIDISGLFSMAETDERWNAVELLDRFSMINLNNGVVDIHSLVQEVTRHNLKRENKEESVLKRALEGIDNFNISEEDISHVISVWDYASKYHKLIREFCIRSRYGDNNYTPLHLFVRSDNEKGMHRILKILPQMKNIRNKAGETPLHEAIIKGNMEIVKCLVEHFNVHPTKNVSDKGYKPVSVAALYGNQVLVKYFVSKGASVNSRIRNEFSTLDFAILSGNKTLINYLMEEGANVNKFSQFGSTLHKAISSAGMMNTREDDILEIIKLLLQKDQDLIKTVDSVGKTPLHVAVELGFTKIVETLLRCKGVDVNAKTHINLRIIDPDPGKWMLYSYQKDHDRGYTALHIAAENNNRKIVEILLKNGAHYDVRNMDIKTPLDVANPESEVKNLLNCINDLFKAVQDGKKDEVDSLLKVKNRNELEVILNARNIDGKTTVGVAREMSKKDIKSFLLNILGN